MDTEVLSNELCLKLGKLIETLTHSGLKTLDEKLFKEVKKICKLSPGYVEKAYASIMHQLKKKHAEIRYSAFLMCIELFNKSHVFREALIKDLQLVFELTAETNPKKLLPPPKSVADSLKTLALSTMQKWVDQFGSTYKEIQIAHQYLKHCKRVDFAAMEMLSSAEHARQAEQQRRLAAWNEEKIKKLKEEIKSNEGEIEATITTLTNCITLLLPSPENFFIAGDMDLPETFKPFTSNVNEDEDDDECEDDDSVDLRQHGIQPKFDLVLNLDVHQKIKVKRTEENSSVIDNANDCLRLINNRLMPMIKKWMQICTKHSEISNSEDFKKVMDFKQRLEKCANKYKDLNIEGINSEEASSDDDFEEVEKEGYEESVENIEDLPVVKNLASSTKKSDSEWKISLGEDEKDPTSALSNLKKVQNQGESTPFAKPSTSKDYNSVPSTSKSTDNKFSERKKKLLKTAPKIPFDIDLYHWEDENLKAPTLLSVKLDNPKFWGTSTVDEMDEIPNPDGVAALRTRVIEFSGTFEPVKWSCRAPLPNGKLCPRKDRFKCPFHGEIVARDETGRCMNEEDEKRLKKQEEEKQQEQPEWQDPQLLADLEAATGVNLKMPEKKVKGKKRKLNNKSKITRTNKKMKTSASTVKEIEKRKFPGLTDIISKQNNSYKRLSKKIFNKSALNRVASALNKIERRKFRDKYGDQFNYVYETS